MTLKPARIHNKHTTSRSCYAFYKRNQVVSWGIAIKDGKVKRNVEMLGLKA